MKIKKVTRIERPEYNFKGLEVIIEINGEEKIECFDDADYWLEIENNEERFITRLKETHLNPKIIEGKKSITKEIEKFKNKEVK